MEKIYIIIEENGYDAFYLPYNEEFYLKEEDAIIESNRLNKSRGGKRADFDVHELTLKKK